MRPISSHGAGTSGAGPSHSDDSDTSPPRQRAAARHDAPEGLPPRQGGGFSMPSARTVLSRTYNTTAVGLMATGVHHAVTQAQRGDGTAAAQGVHLAQTGFTMLAGRAIATLAAPMVQEAIAAVRRMFAPQIDRDLLLGALNHVAATSEDDPDDMTHVTGRHNQQVVDHLADLADGVADRRVVDLALQATDSRTLVHLLLGLARGDHGQPVISRRATSSSGGR